MELKWKAGLKKETLERLSDNALKQIDDRHYYAEMTQSGIDKILMLGIAFSGKKILIKAKQISGET